MSKLLALFFVLFLTVTFANEEVSFEKDVCEEKYDNCISKCMDNADSSCDSKCEELYDRCYEEKYKAAQ